MKINLNGIYDISRFVDEANRVRPGVNIKSGNIVIDGASFLSMMNINMTNGVIVEYPDDAEEFEKFISQFKVA